MGLLRRRGFVKIVAVSGLSVAGIGAGAAVGAVRSRSHPFFASFDQVTQWLDDAAAKDPATSGPWPLSTILCHCAQSIELTLSGFPSLKSPTFRKTIGPTAYRVFSSLGGTRHGLSDLIPGTKREDVDAPLPQSITRLRDAIGQFRRHDGELKPHFAYGALSRDQLERAHAMHFSEHLSEIAGT